MVRGDTPVLTGEGDTPVLARGVPQSWLGEGVPQSWPGGTLVLARGYLSPGLGRYPSPGRGGTPVLATEVPQSWTGGTPVLARGTTVLVGGYPRPVPSLGRGYPRIGVPPS